MPKRWSISSFDSDVVGVYNQANKWNTMGSQTITGMVQGVAQPMFVEVGTDTARQRQVFRKMLRFTCFISFLDGLLHNKSASFLKKWRAEREIELLFDFVFFCVKMPTYDEKRRWLVLN